MFERFVKYRVSVQEPGVCLATMQWPTIMFLANTIGVTSLPPVIQLTNSTPAVTGPFEAASYNFTTGPASRPTIRCSRVDYGSNLNVHSCRNVLDKMGNSNEMKSYGPRYLRKHSEFQVTLPIRYLSDDGRCAVDVNFIGSGSHNNGDVSSEFAIKTAAEEIMIRCVVGKAGGIGREICRYIVCLYRSPFLLWLSSHVNTI